MRVGIVGGGQLARMMVLAGVPLGLRFCILDPAADAGAGVVAELIEAPYDDADGLRALGERVDLVTFDFENVPEAAARALQDYAEVYPPPPALAAAQDRLTEKTLCGELDIATAEFAAVDDAAGLRAAVERLGLPALLKTRRFGYDGKGQRALATPADVDAAAAALDGTPMIVEAWVDFDRELSLLALRGRDGVCDYYPLTENHHRDGILRLSRAPYRNAALEQQARRYADRLLQRLDYVGVLAVEFFVVGQRLLVNEMAPRVHNSGHWTIEGAVTSQFENHLRAVCGLPLGSTAARGHSAMVNFIGECAPRRRCLALPGVHYHDYGKTPRPGRKVGHATLNALSTPALSAPLAALLRAVDADDLPRE